MGVRRDGRGRHIADGRSVEVEAMSEESALTREEIAAIDDEEGTLGFEPPADNDDEVPQFDERAVRAQQPEDRS